MHFSSLFSMRESNGHDGSVSQRLFFFLSITVISGLICSKHLPVSMGKPYRILHLFDSRTFSGSCLYHFPVFWSPHFSQSFQFYSLNYVSPVYTPVLVLDVLLHHTISISSVPFSTNPVIFYPLLHLLLFFTVCEAFFPLYSVSCPILISSLLLPNLLHFRNISANFCQHLLFAYL